MRSGLYFGYARLKPGVTFAQAEADVKRVAAEIAALDRASHPSYTARTRRSAGVGSSGNQAHAAVADGCCGSAAAHHLRGRRRAAAGALGARARETAIRVALGAPQRRLALQYFMEGLIVSLVGAAAGVLLSAALVRTVVALAAEYIPRADEIALDWTVLLFAGGCALLATALASMAPLWQAVRTVPADVLGDGVRATASARSRRLSHALVVGEIALAFTLARRERRPRHAPAQSQPYLAGLRSRSPPDVPGHGPSHRVRRGPARSVPTVHRRARRDRGRHRRRAHQFGPARRLLLQHDDLPGGAPREPRDGAENEFPHRQPGIPFDAAGSSSQRAIPRRARYARGFAGGRRSTRLRSGCTGRDRTRSVLTGAWAGRTAIDFKWSASSETSATTAWATRRCPRSTCRAPSSRSTRCGSSCARPCRRRRSSRRFAAPSRASIRR